jgi:anti-anti-sigma regulatory factor
MLRFVRLDRYIRVATDMPEALAMLRLWEQTSQEGSVRVEPGRQLVVALPAELTAANVAGFRAGVDAAWDKMAADGEVAAVAVDASGVGFIDSAGLGFLVALRKKALLLPGRFHCSGFRGNARQTLAIARLENLFVADAARLEGMS